MYRFVGRMTADDIEAVAAQAYVEMLEAGFTRVGEFHYIHHDVSGAPYGNLARTGRAHRGGGAGDRHRPDAAAGVLCPCRFRRSCARSGPAALHQRHRRICAADGCQPPRRGGACRARWSGVAPHSLRAVTPEELDAHCCSSIATARSISTSPNKPGKSTNASPGAASGRCNGCSIMSRSIAAGAWFMPRMRPPTKSAGWRKAARWPDCARSPRPISATALSTLRNSVDTAAASASARIPTS